MEILSMRWSQYESFWSQMTEKVLWNLQIKELLHPTSVVSSNQQQHWYMICEEGDVQWLHLRHPLYWPRRFRYAPDPVHRYFSFPRIQLTSIKRHGLHKWGKHPSLPGNLSLMSDKARNLSEDGSIPKSLGTGSSVGHKNTGEISRWVNRVKEDRDGITSITSSCQSKSTSLSASKFSRTGSNAEITFLQSKGGAFLSVRDKCLEAGA